MSVANAQLSFSLDLGPEYVGPIAGMPVTVTFVEETSGVPLTDQRTKVLNASGNFGFTLGELQSLPFSSGQSVTAKVRLSHWITNQVEGLFPKMGAPGTPYELGFINGDSTGDDQVDIADFQALVDAFGSFPGEPTWNADTDFNGDEIVDIADYDVLSQNFGVMQGIGSDAANWEITYDAEGADYGIAYWDDENGNLISLPKFTSWADRKALVPPGSPFFSDWMNCRSSHTSQSQQTIETVSQGVQKVKVQWIGGGSSPRAVRVAVLSHGLAGSSLLPFMNDLVIENGLGSPADGAGVINRFDKQVVQTEIRTIKVEDGQGELVIEKLAYAKVANKQPNQWATADAFGLAAGIDQRDIIVMPQGSWPKSAGPPSSNVTYLPVAYFGMPSPRPFYTPIDMDAIQPEISQTFQQSVPEVVDAKLTFFADSSNFSTWHVGIADLELRQKWNGSIYSPHASTQFITLSFPVAVNRPEFPLTLVVSGNIPHFPYATSYPTREFVIANQQELDEFRVQIQFERRYLLKRFRDDFWGINEIFEGHQFFYTHEALAMQPIHFTVACSWPDGLVASSRRLVVPHLVLDDQVKLGEITEAWNQLPTALHTRGAKPPTQILEENSNTSVALVEGWIPADVTEVDMRFAPMTSTISFFQNVVTYGTFAEVGTTIAFAYYFPGAGITATIVVAAQNFVLERFASALGDGVRENVHKADWVSYVGAFVESSDGTPLYGVSPMGYSAAALWRVVAVPQSTIEVYGGHRYGLDGYLGGGAAKATKYMTPLKSSELVAYFKLEEN